jgi:hypothetical protein
MTNLPKTIDEKRKMVLQKARTQMDEWREDLNRLENQLSDLSSESGSRAEYQKQLATLKQHWQQVESKFAAMLQGSDEAQEAYNHWRDTAVAYNQAFMRATKNMKEEVPLGWLQGYTDERTQESAGWAEGFGGRPSDSEGFAEGMGHKGKVTSKGWAEGYDKVSKS